MISGRRLATAEGLATAVGGHEASVERRTVYEGSQFDVVVEQWGDREREFVAHPGSVGDFRGAVTHDTVS